MNDFVIRQSSYAIQPWMEDSSTIPNRFLTRKTISKTLLNNNKRQQSKKQLEMGTKSVYYIQNNQEEASKTSKFQKYVHKTAQNSPQMTSKNEINNKNKLEISSRMIRTMNSLSKNGKNRLEESQSQEMFMMTKQKMIEFKMTNKSKVSSEHSSVVRNSFKKEMTTNLLKIYERSTFYNQNKKQSRIPGRLTSPSLKHKFKTQNQQNQSQNLHMNFLDSKEESRLCLQKSEMKTEKLKFELLLERKLFLMRNTIGPQYKIKEKLNKRFSKVINK